MRSRLIAVQADGTVAAGGYRDAGGPQQTSMAVKRRNTRMEMCARTVLGMDIRLQVCQKPDGHRSNNFYRAYQGRFPMAHGPGP